MYAIVDIAGQQFKVEKDKKLFVHRLEGNTGSEISFDKVLLIENDGKITLGDPLITDAAVSAKVVEHVKGDKVLVFKKKRRKGYRKLNGHRQYLTQIEITGITEKAAKKPAAKATEEKATEEKKETAPKADAKKADAEPKAATAAPKAGTDKKAAEEKAAPAKKPAAKKPAAKKPAATKSTAAKKPAEKKSEGGEKAADKE